MAGILTQTVVNAIALWIVDALWGSIWVTPKDGETLQWALVYLVIGLLLALVNSIIKPVIKVLALPLMVLTLGLFALVVNAAMLELVSWLTDFTPVGLHIENFSTAVGAGLVLAVLTAIISIPFRKARRVRA